MVQPWYFVIVTLLCESSRGSLCLRHRDAGSFGVVEAVHRVDLEDHVEAVRKDPQHQQSGQEAHPDPRGEEARAVARVREERAVTGHIKPLNLQR